MIHNEESPLAGKTVLIKETVQNIGGRRMIVEDWWDRVHGKSWHVASGNPAAITYAIRIAGKEVPLDNEVIYGKVAGLGFLLHVSEIVGALAPEPSQDDDFYLYGPPLNS